MAPFRPAPLLAPVTRMVRPVSGEAITWLSGAANQVEELGTRARVLAERAEHARRDELPARLLDAAHLHAQVTSLDNDSDALRRNRSVQCLGDLLGHAFLQLQSVGEDADQARDLAQADHLP